MVDTFNQSEDFTIFVVAAGPPFPKHFHLLSDEFAFGTLVA